MNETIRARLKELPRQPGVYFHKSDNGEIIYVGKAAVLSNRVRQYFQASRSRDPKTELLVAEIADIDWQVVDSEVEALFLEAEMIRRYMPRYNILLRDDKSMTYVRINLKDEYPSLIYIRRPLDDGAEYYGPFLSASSLKRALKYLRRVFPYSTHTAMPKRACLQYHLGLCPGPETGKLDSAQYKANLRSLIQVLKGRRKKLIIDLEKAMKAAATAKQFEQAAKIRDQVLALKNLSQQIVFSDKEFQDISKDHALADLIKLLGLTDPPRRIEGFDVSHMSGTDTVASMVVFTNGVSDKASYRKFKSRVPGNDDVAHIREAMIRRFSDKNRKQWGMPDMVLIDGGKGQLAAALQVLRTKGIALPVIGLAKRDEEIVVSNNWPYTKLNSSMVLKLRGFSSTSDDFTLVNLPNSSHVVKLLQRIRDESHRFAVSYHSVLKTKRQTASILDGVPGVGPATRKKLIKAFGSLRGVVGASQSDLERVLGPKKAASLWQYLKPAKVTKS